MFSLSPLFTHLEDVTIYFAEFTISGFLKLLESERCESQPAEKHIKKIHKNSCCR